MINAFPRGGGAEITSNDSKKQMPPLNCGVIGTGHLGKFHAEKYARVADCELAAVADLKEKTRREIAARYSTAAVADYHDLLGKLDAVSIVTPTSTHYRIARDFIESGAHVLIEKPMTATLDEADELIELAERHRRLLQVGHVERFNPALLALGDLLRDPVFIESTRLMPLNQRHRNTCVILDLMIHDLDIILNLVPSGIADVRTNGAEVVSSNIDIAGTRIEFTNGCTANITASRISRETTRKLRLFKKNHYFSIDLYNNRCTSCHRSDEKNVDCEEHSFPGADALLTEIEHFLACIRNARQPLVGGREGRRALEAAIRVSASLKH